MRRPEAFAKQLRQAATAQTVTITRSTTAARLISELAAQLAAVLARRDELEKEIEQAFFALPEASILRSLPGIGPRLGARIAVEIGSIYRFRTPAQLAAYAGLGPTPRKSGTSINANMPSRFGNHRLKNALFLAAFASLRHAPSRTYYDRKPAQGKRQNHAVLCLARRPTPMCSTPCSANASPIVRRLLYPMPLDKQDRSTPGPVWTTPVIVTISLSMFSHNCGFRRSVRYGCKHGCSRGSPCQRFPGVASKPEQRRWSSQRPHCGVHARVAPRSHQPDCAERPAVDQTDAAFHGLCRHTVEYRK
ncbi:MAG: IS110 family transposase [Chloroflexi bacterium]|nr:IS110 family transposase [Chloroflexota bacterium]